MIIIGVSGPYAAGKGEVVGFLVGRGFQPLSLSDVIRDELAAQGLSETRERMIEAGTRLRREGGEGVLAERLVRKFERAHNYVIDSIRHPAEVEALRRADPGFRLIWVDAPLEIRFERLRSRGRPGDPETLEALRAMEAREAGGADPAGQQLDAIRAGADFTVSNAGDLGKLHEELQRVLQRSLYFERPTWDLYFMDIARVVANRSNCVKRKVGAVIVRERRIISTGYNGTPRGVRNCNQGGCPRCNSFAAGGTRLDECLCSHGEENAITQAAFHGVSVREGTIYTTFSPCLMCTKMIINSGLAEVVYDAAYPLSDVPLALLREAGIKVRQAEEADRPPV